MAQRKGGAVRICLVFIVLTLGGCSTTSSLAKPPSPVAIASCPPLTPLTDDTFAATTNKLAEVASIYNECRKAIGLK
jgi:hypothetical protein